jgi:hypothetical protein
MVVFEGYLQKVTCFAGNNLILTCLFKSKLKNRSFVVSEITGGSEAFFNLLWFHPSVCFNEITRWFKYDRDKL